MVEPGPLEVTRLRRVSFRLLPFLMLTYLVCYINGSTQASPHFR